MPGIMRRQRIFRKSRKCSGNQCGNGGMHAYEVEDFEAVGGFDEEFVVAFNDIDLCMKERAAGKKLYLHHMRNFITMNPSQGEWKTHRKNSSVSKRKQNISKRNGANR